MNIAGYIKTSLIEWPGKISSVIFTLGCNFCCPFCHNADLVLRKGFTLIPEKQIFADLEKRKDWIDLVVFSGGEPTLQNDLPDFLGKIKKMKLKTMVETNGTNPKMIALLLKNKLVDFFSMDLKSNFDNYKVTTDSRCDTNSIKKSIEEIIRSGVEYEFRTTVVPELHNLENLQQLAKEIKEIFEKCKTCPEPFDYAQGKLAEGLKVVNCSWYLQQFRPINTFDKKFLGLKPFPKEEMEDWQKKLQKIIPRTLLRGV